MAGIFLALAAIHVCWACGGRWGAASAVPARDGQPLFRPSGAATIAVALLLGLSATATLGAGTAWRPPWPPRWVYRASTGLLAIVFLARAIGDFRWVGFFKRPSGSSFAQGDTALYAPLCMMLAVGCAVLTFAPSPED